MKSWGRTQVSISSPEETVFHMCANLCILVLHTFVVVSCQSLLWPSFLAVQALSVPKAVLESELLIRFVLLISSGRFGYSWLTGAPHKQIVHFESVRWGERTGRIVRELNGKNHRTSTSLLSNCSRFGSRRLRAATHRNLHHLLRWRGGAPRKERFLSWRPGNPESGEPADHASRLRVHDRGVRSAAGTR